MRKIIHVVLAAVRPLTLTVLLAITVFGLHAQTLYIDPVNGKPGATGTQTAPLSSLEAAVEAASKFTGAQPITLKLYPGLYTLWNRAIIRTASADTTNDNSQYTIEAVCLPDDTSWTPAKMPVISSVSANNTTAQFPHCAGLTIAKNNVTIHGIKFLGNPNPSVNYYYPINRENEKTSGLDISQCYFIGEKNSAPIQGAIWAHGANIHVDHCIFYQCKNALLLFHSITGFSVTHSVIDGSYEAAVWFGPYLGDFEFSNNIVTNCAYFWLRGENTAPTYTFKNSIIANNEQFMGFYTHTGTSVATDNKHTETNIRKSATIRLSEVKTEGLLKDYLNPLPGSDGSDLKAGIFH